MRIGVHSGSAVVGNLGSAKRLSYTAVGDDVNTAARLEGINKLYGTGIMVSGDTARQIEGRIALRPVDRVIVKGKSQAVEVFTPCDDPAIVELTGTGHSPVPQPGMGCRGVPTSRIARDCAGRRRRQTLS